jgi:hypothetical protein
MSLASNRKRTKGPCICTGLSISIGVAAQAEEASHRTNSGPEAQAKNHTWRAIRCPRVLSDSNYLGSVGVEEGG